MLNFSWTKTVPIIKQTEVAECGLACLAMILGYHGHDVDLMQMRTLHSTGLKGMSFSDLSKSAETMGLNSRGVQCDIDKLDELQLPAILHWDMNHYVVLTKISNGRYYINDPARGKIVAAFNEMDDNYTGVALELSPGQDFDKVDERQRLSISMLYSKLHHFKRNLLKVIGLSIVIQAIILLTPYYTKIILDDVFTSFDEELLFILAISFGALALFDVFARFLRGWLLIRISSLFGLQAGVNIMSHLLKLPMGYFESRHLGDINTRFSSLSSIRDTITTGFTESVIDGLMSIIIVIVLFNYSPTLAFVVLGFTTSYAVLRMAMHTIFKRASEEHLIRVGMEQSHFIESARGMQTIKLHNYEKARSDAWQTKFVDVINAEINLGKLNLTFETANRLLFGIENVLVIFLITHMVLDGELTLGAMMAFLAYKNRFSESMIKFIENAVNIKILSLHLERVSDIALTQKEAFRDGDNHTTLPDGPLDITLDNVSFRYDDHQPYVLQNINLHIKAGESVALTGPSGSGKTTLIKIMLGLLQPTEGTVSISGVDIRTLGLQNYREHIASIMQNDALLSGTLRDNITFFDTEADTKRMERAAYRAAIYDDIKKMPLGFETFVGDMGSTLSGGQIQRVLIARSLYKESAIMFMDEATSHLDVDNEKRINDYLSSLETTRVSIAHREESIKMADRIINLLDVNHPTA